jgi:hypothetical protein
VGGRRHHRHHAGGDVVVMANALAQSLAEIIHEVEAGRSV